MSSVVVRENPFYILNLAVSASKADIDRQAATLTSLIEMRAAGAGEYPTPMGPQKRSVAMVMAAVKALSTPGERVRAAVWAAPEAKTDAMSRAVWALIELDGRPHPRPEQVEAVGVLWQQVLCDRDAASLLQHQCEELGVVGYILQPALREDVCRWMAAVIEEQAVHFGHWATRPDLLGELAETLSLSLTDQFQALCSRCARGTAEVHEVQSAYQRLGALGGDTLQRRNWDTLYVCLQGVSGWQARAVRKWMAPFGERFARRPLAEHFAAARRSSLRVTLVVSTLIILVLGSLAWMAWHRASNPRTHPDKSSSAHHA